MNVISAEHMDFYTAILRQSAGYWVALCLENGLVGQGETREQAIAKLKEAIESFQEIYESRPDIQSSPVPIKELHKFLTIAAKEPPIFRQFEFTDEEIESLLK